MRKISFRLMVATCLLLSAERMTLSQDGQIGDVEEFTPTWRVRGEYLHWWASKSSLPPLVTTSPAGTPRTDAGVLGTPGVDVLFGNNAVGGGDRSGGRLTLTRWLDPDSLAAVEFTGFYVGDDYQSGDYFANSDGSRILARPFYNAALGQEDSELVAFPAVLAGSVAVNSYSEIYSGAGLLRYNVGLGSRGRLDILSGYRYFRFRESLSIHENLESIDPGGLIPLGTTFDIRDRFDVASEFHGGELALSAEFFVNNSVTLEFLAKVAIGGTIRHSTITGQSIVTTPPNNATVTQGGLLALPTNIGSRKDRDFGVLPEFGINANVAVTTDVSLQFGYSIMILNDVLRAGPQMDRNVNPSQIGGNPLAGAPSPEFAWRPSDLLLQGLNIGVECRW